ncbi:HD domain-containing protein [Elusimicrobiota bacterium]
MSKDKMNQLSRIVDTVNEHAVFEEVKCIFIQNYPAEEFVIIRKVFKDLLNLYNGLYPGYGRCNTPYHDINHVVNTLLAFFRLVDGYNLQYEILPVEKVRTGMIAALFHDCGYIPKKGEDMDSGAKFIQNHEKRSIEFLNDYMQQMALENNIAVSAGKMIACTDINCNVSEIKFEDPDEMTLGFMLGTADLIGQMSSRTYLESLLLLYKEFVEAGVSMYSSEADLLTKTEAFYKNVVRNRLEKMFESKFCLAQIHFKERYHIDKDLYIEAIERQIKYVRDTIKRSPELFLNKLRRK